MHYLESSWKFARRRTATAHKLRFWIVEVCLMVAGGTWLTVIASDAASIGERVLRAVGGGFLGVIVGLSFIFLSYLVYAPYSKLSHAVARIAEIEGESDTNVELDIESGDNKEFCRETFFLDDSENVTGKEKQKLVKVRNLSLTHTAKGCRAKVIAATPPLVTPSDIPMELAWLKGKSTPIDIEPMSHEYLVLGSWVTDFSSPVGGGFTGLWGYDGEVTLYLWGNNVKSQRRKLTLNRSQSSYNGFPSVTIHE